MANCADFSYFYQNVLTTPDQPTTAQPLNVFRAQFMGRQWGLTPYFLAYSQATDIAACPATCASTCASLGKSLANEAIGIAMIHDVGLWSPFLDQATLDGFGSTMQHVMNDWSFDFINSVFHPYFARAPSVASSVPSVLASAYITSTRALIAVVNASWSSSQSATLALLASDFFSGAAVDVYDSTSSGDVLIGPAGGGYPITIEKRQFKLLVVVPHGAASNLPVNGRIPR
jgi:hypothetical protein